MAIMIPAMAPLDSPPPPLSSGSSAGAFTAGIGMVTLIVGDAVGEIVGRKVTGASVVGSIVGLRVGSDVVGATVGADVGLGVGTLVINVANVSQKYVRCALASSEVVLLPSNPSNGISILVP